MVASDLIQLCDLNTDKVVLEVSDNSRKGDKMQTTEKLQTEVRKSLLSQKN